MLLPPTFVFIVYGHQARLLDATIKAIEAAQGEGFRVRPVVLDEARLSELKADSIYEALRKTMTVADAAITLATADDLGGKKTEIQAAARKKKTAGEILHHLKPRARQNVILELGMLLQQVGDQRLLILTDREAEPPSDLVGRFWEFIENMDDVELRVQRFIRQIARRDRALPLTDESLAVSFAELRHVGDVPLTTFSEEFAKLDSSEDRALYLAERLVFDSYIQNPSWWRERLNEIQPSESRPLMVTLDILEHILAYMRAWMPPDREEYHEVELACGKLDAAIRRFEADGVPLNPAVRLAAYDFLGLAKHKMSRAPYLRDAAKGHLQEALSAFDHCSTLADRFDDRVLKLWRGYTLFNSARVLHELMEHGGVEERKDLRKAWKARMAEAIDLRSRWRTASLDLPSVIQDGLTTEYFHAIAVRILRAERDESGAVSEAGPFSIDENWLAERRREFREWWDHPHGLRVRLATNVKENWTRIDAMGR